jgi:hypothetical protein
MPARAQVKQHLSLRLVEHRRDHRDIGQMRTTVIRRVEHVHITRPHAAGIAADDRLHALTHRAEMHGHVRSVGDQLAARFEERTRKIQPLLDVYRVGSVLQSQPYLLGDTHEQIVEHLEHHRIGLRADGEPGRARLNTLEHELIARIHQRAPAGLDDLSLIGFGDDRRARQLVPGLQVGPAVERGSAPLPARKHAHALGSGAVSGPTRLCPTASTDTASTISGFSGIRNAKRCRYESSNAERMRPPITARVGCQLGQRSLDRRQRRVIQPQFQRALAQRALIGQTHPVRRVATAHRPGADCRRSIRSPP